MKSFNIGIIGPGRHADLRLAPALTLSPSATLWSVLSRDLDRASTFAEKHNARAKSPAHTSLDEMLSDPDLHAVLIASPDKLHVDQVLRAAEAGKHCLVEKPLATEVEDCKKMILAAETADICLAVAYHLRWHQGHRLIHQKVSQGSIGEIRHVRAHWTWKALDGSNWRASPHVGKWWSAGGVGTHCLDLIRWMMLSECGEVVSIQSIFSSKVWNRPHDETAIISLEFESGATAELCSSVLFDSPSRFEVYGSEGCYVCEETFGYAGAGRVTSARGDLNFSVENPFVGEIENFVDAARNGTAPEVCGNEGLRNIEILTEASRVSGLGCYSGQM